MDSLRLENFDPALFLREYWQKKPLLLSAALADFRDPLSPDELAGLALEEDIESRIISNPEQIAKALANQWQLQLGPFSEQDFSRPDHHWTLLVQAVDHHLPEVRKLLQAFRFIPDWRVDDIMVSYATDQGSVGPHYDNYDVFLVQGLGQRRWQIGQHCPEHTPLLDHPSLRILDNFNCEQEYILGPGDILYIPPRIAHWGTAIGETMTYSIGFRAPSHSELISHWCDYLLSTSTHNEHLDDAAIETSQHPAEIAPAAIKQMRETMTDLLDQPRAMEDWFAKLVTEPKYPDPDRAMDFDLDSGINKNISKADTIALITQEKQLIRAVDCRLAFIRRQHHLDLYASGETMDSSQASVALIEYLCFENTLSCKQLQVFCSDTHRDRDKDKDGNKEADANLTLLTDLINGTYLYAE